MSTKQTIVWSHSIIMTVACFFWGHLRFCSSFIKKDRVVENCNPKNLLIECHRLRESGSQKSNRAASKSLLWKTGE